ncbi:MAG TPA: hypothetical protein VFO69_09835 [Allosphingosinicella sp.]|nr:hypothetical protein [Allosphingosinicella sp.]
MRTAALKNDRPSLLAGQAIRIEARKRHIDGALDVLSRIFIRFPHIDDQR